MTKDKNNKVSFSLQNLLFLTVFKCILRIYKFLICRLLVFISHVILFKIKLAKNSCNIIILFPIIIF